MPQPRKATVDYFPHFTSNGKTIYILESKFQNNGYAFWFKVLEILGCTEHHFINCNDKSTWQFLIAKSNLEEKKAIDILNLLSELDAIDSELWKLKIIRSENFIRNLSAVYQRRKIDVITKDEIIANMSTITPLNGERVNIYPQSIVKERKGKESKGNGTPVEPENTDTKTTKQQIQNKAKNFFSHYVSLAHTADHEVNTKTYDETIKKITSKTGIHSLVRYLKTDEDYYKLVAILDRWHEYHRLVDEYGLRTGHDSEYFFSNTFRKFLEKFTEFEEESSAQQKINYVRSKGQQQKPDAHSSKFIPSNYDDIKERMKK